MAWRQTQNTVRRAPSLEWQSHLHFFIRILVLFGSTVPLKGKLTVSTRFSKLDLRVAKVETFEFRDARIESRELRVEDRESRNEEFWNIHELEFVRELAIHLSKKDNNYVRQYYFQLLHMSQIPIFT